VKFIYNINFSRYRSKLLLIEGRITGLILLIIMAFISIYMALIAERWSPQIRQLAGISVIPELIGRCAELGKPLHFTTGQGGSLAETEVGPQIMAGLSVFNYVARLCVKNGVKLIVSVGQTDTMGLLQEYVRDAYTAEGLPVPDMEEILRFHSRNQFAFISAVSGLMRRELPASNIVIGPIWAESAQLVCSGLEVGAMQLIGTARTSHIPFFAILSDYVLMGEEIYAAGAQLSGDKQTTNTLAAQDVSKFISILLLIIGVVFFTMTGNNFIKNLLGM